MRSLILAIAAVVALAVPSVSHADDVKPNKTQNTPKPLWVPVEQNELKNKIKNRCGSDKKLEERVKKLKNEIKKLERRRDELRCHLRHLHLLHKHKHRHHWHERHHHRDHNHRHHHHK